MDIQNKIVIITGASSGIGEATARLLAAKGAKVVLAARSKDKLEKLAKELPEALVVVTDMTKAADIKHLIETTKERYGRVDILINNAGQSYVASTEATNVAKYRYILELNVIGPLLAMQAAIPSMRAQRSGVIVNISTAASVMNIPDLGAYISTKRALNGISLTARIELEKDNIKVCVLHPYFTATNLFKNALLDRISGAGNVHSGTSRPLADTPEHVAEKVLEIIQSEAPEVFMQEQKGKC